MLLIDNINQTMQKALKNALTTAGHVDIEVGYFYFSGYEAIAEDLKDKKVRILVGKTIDPALIPKVNRLAKEHEVNLDDFKVARYELSRTQTRKLYLDSLVGLTNDSETFENSESRKAYKAFMDKIKDGSLQIRMTGSDFHGKAYIIHNKKENSQNGDMPGTIISGSSNLTHQGLIGQGELNESSREKSKFDEYYNHFIKNWEDSTTISIADSDTKDEFIKTIQKNSRIGKVPPPYLIYARILHEIFAHELDQTVESPAKITKGQYSDLEYQIDAIKMCIDRLERYDGAILADVVGLGKSIIAATVARNLDLKTVIVAPPHLIPQWEDYKEEFGIRGSKVFSSGKISEVYERYKDTKDPLLIVLDEAHRYRNEDTDDYKLLHEVCRSDAKNKVLLLTATPFNNDPKDVFALVKLFQTPGQATIRSVDNLSLRFRELIDRYKKLRANMAKGLSQPEIDKEADEIATEQRRLIESIVIRRSRLDLKRIERYRKDLEAQGIDFAKVIGPKLMTYELGPLADLYLETLEKITGGDTGQGFIGARYKPAVYIKDRDEFLKQFGEDLDESDLKTAQTNLAQFMRRLLVMRFESSKDAFYSTLKKMILNNELIEKWWEELGKVPIMKKGQIPNPSDFDPEDGEDGLALDEQLELLKEKTGLLSVDKALIDNNFIRDVRLDTQLLKLIEKDWFEDPKNASLDPKLDNLAERIDALIKENPKRKIVIFSGYADTIDALDKGLNQRGMSRILSYTAAKSSTLKKDVRSNFDASLAEDRKEDKFDILLATDALSEGYNLHRAGIVINYDIPYNPTRVIQRIGRINRINKKVFDELFVYNCFPTLIGEAETRIKSIATLKIRLINSIIGNDTATLTDDEELRSYFKDELDKADRANNVESWDAVHRQAYDDIRKDDELLKQALEIPHRSRVQRRNANSNSAIVFGKKGDHSIFTSATRAHDAVVISIEQGLPLFRADKGEQGYPVDEDFDNTFKLAIQKLFARSPLPAMKGRRGRALNVIKALSEALPKSRDYCDDLRKVIKQYDDLPDGRLKDVAQLTLKDLDKAYLELQKIISPDYIQNILSRSMRQQDEEEFVLFAEELKN